jgi:hypothetical protein
LGLQGTDSVVSVHCGSRFLPREYG